MNMTASERLERINELARKKKSVGLTDAEVKEQAELRKSYLEDFRKNLRGQLENIEIKQPDGTIISVKKRHDERYGVSEDGTRA